jgi:hypothetical protein
MIDDSKLALFVMLGQTASQTVSGLPEVAHSEPLLIGETYDLSTAIPEQVKAANRASLGYRLFFVFENYLREFVVTALSDDENSIWWEKLPPDLKSEIESLEETEESKAWMALGSRDKSALLTYPQLLRVIDHCWKSHFQDIVRDKALIQEARHISHLRNTLCHMTDISEEEVDRVRQVMRDWFRVIAP